MADISKINPNGSEYNLKDAAARDGIESSKTLKSSVVTVNDAAPINAEDITVDITPVQLGSGTPSPDNIRPIEGWTGAELDRVGKNLCYSQVNNTDIATVEAGTYTLSYEGAYKFNLDVMYDGDTTWTRLAAAQNVPYTFTLIKKGTINLNAFSNNISHIQVEKGSTATAYEPYQGQQYTASFGETVYGGKWHVTEGGTDKTNNCVVYDGSNDEGWQLSQAWSTSNTLVFYANELIGALFNDQNVDFMRINNLFKTYSRNDLANLDDNGIGFSGSTQTNQPNPTIRISRNMVADLSGFLTWLSNNPVQVYYELATPTTLSTPKQNVPMLKGINTVSADCGETQLKYQPDNVIGELKGEIQKANSFVSKMALREGSGAKDFSYGGWSFRLYIYRSMGQISMSVERISASSVTEQAVVKVFNGESDYRAPEELRPNFNLLQAATYTTPSGWAIQVYLKDDGYIMFTGIAPEVGASAPTSSNWNLVEPWLVHQQAKDLFNN